MEHRPIFPHIFSTSGIRTQIDDCHCQQLNNHPAFRIPLFALKLPAKFFLIGMRIKFLFWPKISSQAVDFPVKLNFSHIKCNCRPRYLIAVPSCSSDLTEPIILKFTKFSVIGPGLKFCRNWTLPHSVRSPPPPTTFSTFESELPRFRSEVKQVR